VGLEAAAVGYRRGRLELALDRRAGALELELCSFEAPAFVHVVAQPAGSDWARVVMAVAAADEPGEDPGSAVRRLAIREIARAIGVDAARLDVARKADGDGRVPVLELDGCALGSSLSLSHHGRFVAFAFREAIATDGPGPRLDEVGHASGGTIPDAGARSGRGGRTEKSLFGERPAWAPGVHRPSGFVGDPIRRMATAWMTG
jgi:hypothetical protein